MPLLFAQASEGAADAEVHAPAVRAASVVEANRTDRRLKLQPHADASLDRIRPATVAPSVAPIGEDGALHLLHDREAILDRREQKMRATELVVTVAAQGVLPADFVEVRFGNRAVRVADLSAYSDGLRSTDLEKALVLCRELLIVEIAAESREFRQMSGCRCYRVYRSRATA